ncbi:MAG TPA: hypothetical protein V6D47_02715 [Oscillatoriaceae cyanobacterium]
MARSRLFLGLLLLAIVGCSSNSGDPADLFPLLYHNEFASPRPSVSIVPANPCAGNQVSVTGSGAPANTTLEVWLMPQIPGGFKAGLYSPADGNGVELGTTKTDASGNFTYAFTFQEPAFDANVFPRGNYELWLVYPPGNIIAPGVIGWQCPPATTVKGMVYDASGRPVPDGTTIEVTVKSDGGAVIYDRTVPVTKGSYALADVPEPATTEFTVKVPGWPARTRQDGTGGIQVKWAGNPSPPVSSDVFTKTQGNPLTYNFGGPSTPDDPDAPAYFLASDAADPDVAFTTLTGKVYDQNGNLVPDSAGAKVIVDAASDPKFHAIVTVTGGAYEVDKVPTGVPASVDLRINPVYPLIYPRTMVLIAPKISGKPNVVNFGGPATPDDPDAPKFPFPSPSPLITGPSPFSGPMPPG